MLDFLEVPNCPACLHPMTLSEGEADYSWICLREDS
jgi:hypothetical protein